MTEIDVTQELTNFDGTPMADPARMCQACGQAVEGATLTLRMVLTSASVWLAPNEQPLEGAVNIKRLHLGLRIQREDKPDLSVEDKALLMDRVRLMRPPQISAQTWLILDPSLGQGEGKVKEKSI